jgi:hypothetical protein
MERQVERSSRESFLARVRVVVFMTASLMVLTGDRRESDRAPPGAGHAIMPA